MKQKLVVIGNGMAGARAVGGGPRPRDKDRFDIVMFGDEPYGNYNRILLSNILSGAQDTSEIFINPLAWYEENGIKLHAGAPVDEIDRAAKVVRSETASARRYDKLLIATGSRAFIPPMAGINGPDGKLKPGVFGFRTIDDCNAIVLKAKESRRAVGDRRRAARPRGGARAPQPRLRGPRRAPRRASHGDAARYDRRLDPALEHAGDGRQRPSPEDDHRGAGRGPRHRPRLQGRHHARLRHGGGVRRHQAECGDRPALRAQRRARDRGRQPHAVGERSQRLRGRRMRPAPRPRLRPGGAAVGAGEGVRRPHHRARSRTPPITARSSRPSSR